MRAEKTKLPPGGYLVDKGSVTRIRLIDFFVESYLLLKRELPARTTFLAKTHPTSAVAAPLATKAVRTWVFFGGISHGLACQYREKPHQKTQHSDLNRQVPRAH